MAKFSQIIADVGFLTPIDAGDPTLSNYVNRRISAAIKQHTNVACRWSDLEKQDTITLTSGSDIGILPYDCDELENLWHQIYNYQTRVPVLSRQRFRDLALPTSQSGRPFIATPMENQGVLTQPTSASVLSISSSDATDIIQSVRVYGIVSGYPDSETVALNTTDGTTPVSTTKSFTSVIRITKNLTTAGRITITSNSGVVTVAVFPALYEAHTLDYRKIKVWQIPDQSYTLYADFYMKQRDLIDDNDIPLLDDNHTEAFIQLGCFYASKSENKKKFKDAYDDILKDLKNKYASKPSIDTRFEVDIRRGRLFPDFNSPHPDFGYPR